MSRPRLTLCVIARDEEHHLPGCLASVRGVVDRSIVVDTGSRDRTAEIAREAGAEVIEHAWDDDFAAARNAALPFVKDGHVLVLDADERLAAGSRPLLQAAIRRRDFDLGLLPLHNASSPEAEPAEVLTGRARSGGPVWLPRLLRRTPDLAWQGCVHESIGAWAVGRKACFVEAPIVHYGACPELRGSLGKDARNHRLLEKRVAESPDDPIAHAYLARERQRAGDASGALEASAAAWSALEASRAADASRFDVVQPATVHAHLLLIAGDPQEALAVTERARAWAGEHPNLIFLGGVALEQLATASTDADARASRLEASIAAYHHCLEAAPTRSLVELLPGVRGWQSQLRLGLASLKCGRLAQATQALDCAARSLPDDANIALARAEAKLVAGDAQAALGLLAPLIEHGPPDAWALSAEAALACGSVADARLFAQRAAALAADSRFAEPHRRQRFTELLEALRSDRPRGTSASARAGATSASVK